MIVNVFHANNVASYGPQIIHSRHNTSVAMLRPKAIADYKRPINYYTCPKCLTVDLNDFFDLLFLFRAIQENKYVIQYYVPTLGKNKHNFTVNIVQTRTYVDILRI